MLLRRCAAACLPIVLLGGCKAAPGGAPAAVAGDAATRLVAEVRDGAARLARSPSDTLVLSVASTPSPGGCPDGYRVEWRADSDRIPGLGVVCTTGTRGYASIAYRQFVKVPRPLQVTKGVGEPVAIGLHKRTDGVIEITALR